MAKKVARAQILERLRAQLDNGRPVIMFGAGIGLTAKCAERGGADLIGVYSTAIFRMRGLPTVLAWLPYGDANDHLFAMAREILPAIKDVPCIAGVGAHHPALDFDDLFERVVAMGFSGLNNEPFCGLYGEFFAGQLEQAGVGFSREVELIARARDKDLFTVAWAMTPDEAKRLAEAGADVVGVMIGVTTGGLSGAAETASLAQAARDARAMAEAAKGVNPDIIVLTHGGPFNDVETAQYSIAHAGADGYACGSSGERIPTERAVTEITRQYKAMRLRLD